MHLTFLSSTSGAAFLAAAALMSAPSATFAASFTVPAGATTTTQQAVSGADSGLIEAGGALDVEDAAIVWDAPATGTGVSIVNRGAIASEGRGVDTDGTLSGVFRLENAGTIATINDGFRLDDAFAGGALTIVNSGSIASADGQPFDFNDATAATARVTIENSGSITAAGNDAIRLGGGTISIVNSGTIATTGDETRAISFDDDPNVESLQSFTLVNAATGRIVGTDDAFKISADGDANASAATISIENRGTISGGVGQALDFADLTSADNVISIVNYGTIQSATADAVRPGAGATVTNFGLIQSTDLSSDGDGVDFQGAGGTVVNKAGGRIISAKHGVTGDGATTIVNEAGAEIVARNGAGVNIDSTDDDLTTVTNRGLIRGEVTGNLDDDGDPDGVPDGDGDGVDVDGRLALDNYGAIQGTGATGTNDGVANTADGIAAGGGTIRNRAGAVIEAFDTFEGGTGRAILIDDSEQGAAPFATTLINEGTIRSDGVAITFIGDNADTIENAGVISSAAAVAVDMGGGGDLFVAHAGSSVTGAVSGGAGADTLALAGSGAFALSGLADDGAFRLFETLSVTAGSTYSATGTSAFTGDVRIAGALALDGSLAFADTTVASGGRLSGRGALGSLDVQSGGAVSPGGSAIGTLDVGGALGFAAGSTYAVDVSGSTADRITAGTATLAGGAVAVTPLSGSLDVGTAYLIVTAGQVTGTFDGLQSPSFLFVNPTLVYADASVGLAFQRNDRSFASVAATRNQARVADAIDAAGPGAPVYGYLVGSADADDARAGLDLLSGEAHASLGSTLASQNMLVVDTLLSRLRQASAGGQAFGSGGPALAYAAEPDARGVFKGLVAPPTGPVYAAWAQGFGQWTRAEGDRGAARTEGMIGGLLAGFDVTMDNLTFGVAGGYASADSNVDGRRSRHDADTYLIAAYVGAAFDALKLRGGASFGWSEIDSDRTIAIGGLNERARASYDGTTATAFAEAAYTFGVSLGVIEPFAQVAWSSIDTDSFRETGAPVGGLRSGGLSFDTVYGTLGARAAAPFDLQGARVIPHASLAWRHAAGDVTPEVANRFLDGGVGSFSISGAPVARNSLVAGAGVDVSVSANVLVGVAYEGQFGDDARTNAVRGTFTYRF